MARNTTVNLVSEKGRKLTAEEHDETIGNLKQTADEAFNNAETLQSEMSEGFDFLFDNKLDKTEQAADSALLQGKGIGTNPGDVATIGDSGWGIGTLPFSTETDLNKYTINGTFLTPAISTLQNSPLPTGNRLSPLIFGGSVYQAQLVSAQGNRLYFRNHPTNSSGWSTTWAEVAFLDSAQSMTNKKVSFQNTNDAAANVLDWYEEGSFTPVVVGGTTAGVGTYTTQQGRYTRIGNVVHFSLQITVTTHTGVGELRIAGLPFASTNTYLHPASIGYISGLLFSGQVAAAVVNGQTYIRLYDNPAGSTPSAIPVSTSFLVVIRGSYQV
jgi:hypothetical protein